MIHINRKNALTVIKRNYYAPIFDFYGYSLKNGNYQALEKELHNNSDNKPSMHRHDNYLRDFAIDKNYSCIDLIMLKEFGVIEKKLLPKAIEKACEIIGAELDQEELTAEWKYIISGLYLKAKHEGFSLSAILSKEHYSYCDINGNVLFEKYRIDYKFNDEKQDKYFFQGIKENGKIRKFRKGELQNLIGMYGTFRKYRPCEKIYLCEGEKCVDSLLKRNLKAVTSGSSNDWNSKGEQFSPFFKNVNVVILQDNDSQGEKLTKQIIRFIGPFADSIKIVVPCQEFKGADISDFFDNGGTVEKLEEMEEKTAPIKKESTTKELLDLDQFHHLNKHGEAIGVFDYQIFEYIKKNYSLFVCGFPYLYENGVYLPDYNGTKIKAIIKSLLYPQFIKARIINQVYNLIVEAYEFQRDFTQLNTYPKTYINFKDTMFDVSAMQEIAHSPSFYSINQIPFRYADVKKAKQGEEIEKFFDFIFTSEDDREMLLQYSGYCLTTDVSQQKFLVLCGLGGTGKSILIRLIETSVGSENISCVALQELSRRFSTSLLTGKLLNSCADLSVEALEDSSTLKKLLGEDTIFGERKGQDGYTFKSYAKLLFSANMLPAITNERTNGFYRRLLILKMDKIPSNPDNNLFAKLEKEICYFIRLSLEATNRMYKNGLIKNTENSQELINQMRKDSDVVEAWLQDICELSFDSRAERQKAFDSFEQYCKDEDRQPLSKNGFFKALRNKNFREFKSNGYYYFQGISLEKSALKSTLKSALNDFFEISDKEKDELPFF